LTAIVHITERGASLAERLARGLNHAVVLSGRPALSQVVQENWTRFDGFIFIMAAGIAVRTIAPLLQNKYEDPAVVAVDESGRFAVSLISGHIGGANKLTEEVARILGSEPVVTTASDRMGLTAVDLWVREKGLIPDPPDVLKKSAALLISKGFLNVYVEDIGLELPPDFKSTGDAGVADLVISNRTNIVGAMALRPRNLVLGVGCNRGTPLDEFRKCLTEFLRGHHLSPLSIRNLASIDIKKDEEGLMAFAEHLGVPIDFFSSEQLNLVRNITPSKQAFAATGAQGVCEPAALLSARTENLFIRKTKCKDVTFALAAAD